MNLNEKNKQEKISPIFQKLKMVSNSLGETTPSAANFSLDDLLETPLNPDVLNQTSMELSNTSLSPMEETLTGGGTKTKLLNGYSKIQELKLVKIGLASSERIREWAEKQLPNKKVFGEVLNANTLHYKTFKPHKGGLFCERIFGPLKDFECACGIKQKPNDHETFIQNLLNSKKEKRHFCPNCDVEYTWSVIRRYQLGYIQLTSPVTHLWYLRTNPSYLSLLLDLRKRELESIIYCMQITTLEYYWKPMHSLQMNLTPASLFESYKKYLKLNSSDLKENPKLTLQEKKKRNKRQKQKQIQIIRYGTYSPLESQNTIPSFEKSSLESQIDYLEKSYQLSSPPTSLIRTSKITRFLKQKVSNQVKKRSFLMIETMFCKQFYEENYQRLVDRTFMTQQNVLKKQLETAKIEDVFSLQNKSSGALSIGLLALAITQTKKQNKTFNTQQNFYKTRLFQRIQSELKNTEGRKANLGMNDSMNKSYSNLFLKKFAKLIDQNTKKKTWASLTANQGNVFKNFAVKRSPVILPGFKGSLDNFSSQEYIQNSLFLYLLIMIEKNRDSFLKQHPLDIKEKQMLVATLERLKIAKTSTDLNKSLKGDFEFLSKFLQTNFLSHTNTENLRFYEFDQSFKSTSNLMKVFNPLMNTMTETLFNGFFEISEQLQQTAVSQPFSMVDFQNLPLNSVANVRDVQPANLLKTDARLHRLSDFWFEKLQGQKKVFQFFKNTDAYISTEELFEKNSRNLSRNLLKLKQARLDSSVRMVNNIYTVSYSKGWEAEKDWKYFLYYNTAPIELTDKLMSTYQYRFLSSLSATFSSPIPIIGANLIEKLLLEFEGIELKKMTIHYQNILPKLNRYIRFQKQFASKKSDYLQIQRLLQKRDSIIRRLKFLRKIFKKNTKASSMVLKTLPVLPPDLRPILKMQNQIAASDLNRFYQRILYRNDRLKKFLRMNSSILNSEPGFEIKYAQRLLQESVDNLIQNGKGQVKPETNSRGQPLKSLSEILKGKQGRFRQYLLGKRVDYSGRSVIVVGPSLKIYECGLPFEMAMELFLPFLIKRIFQYNYARTVIGAKTLLQTQKHLTWELLEEVMKNHPILLNRAPTLHRLGIQAFQPKLIEGRAILLHPLVCPAFNADFDGDQMAVHVPITVEARTEAWKLMFSRNHLSSPATGEPMLLPSQDMVLGCYYLTTEVSQYPRFHSGRPFLSGTSFYFSNLKDVLQAYLQERIHLQTPIWVRWNGALQMETQSSQPYEIRLEKTGIWVELRAKTHRTMNCENDLMNLFIRTTAGRVLFNTLIENCLQNG